MTTRAPNKRSVLICGAVGFVGGGCCKLMLSQGCRVTALDNFDPFYARALKESSQTEVSGLPGFRFIEADIRNRENLDWEIGGIDLVIDLAARAGGRPSIASPEEPIREHQSLVFGETVRRFSAPPKRVVS